MRRQGKKLAGAARLHALGQIHTPTDDHDANRPAPEPVVDALAAFGLRLDAGDAQDGGTPPPLEVFDVYHLWPCNLPAWRLWNQVQTQWRSAGMGGRTGLDYDAVLRYMREAARIRKPRIAGLFAAIKVMEAAALNAWAEQNKG